MTPRLSLLIPALVVLAPTVLQAQAQPQDEERMLYRFRVNHLVRNVGLSEEEARQVADRWARYDKDLFDTTRRIRALREQFSDILLGPGSEAEKNAQVRPLLDQFVDLRRKQLNLKLQFEEDIRARLSPAQQVRLIIQVEDMQRRMLEALRRGFGDRMGPGRGFRRGGGGR